MLLMAYRRPDAISTHSRTMPKLPAPTTRPMKYALSSLREYLQRVAGGGGWCALHAPRAPCDWGSPVHCRVQQEGWHSSVNNVQRCRAGRLRPCMHASVCSTSPSTPTQLQRHQGCQAMVAAPLQGPHLHSELPHSLDTHSTLSPPSPEHPVVLVGLQLGARRLTQHAAVHGGGLVAASREGDGFRRLRGKGCGASVPRDLDTLVEWWCAQRSGGPMRGGARSAGVPNVRAVVQQTCGKNMRAHCSLEARISRRAHRDFRRRAQPDPHPPAPSPGRQDSSAAAAAAAAATARLVAPPHSVRPGV